MAAEKVERLRYFKGLLDLVCATLPELGGKKPEFLTLLREEVPLLGFMASYECMYATEPISVIFMKPEAGVEVVIHELIHLNHPELSEGEVLTLEDRWLTELLKRRPDAFVHVRMPRQPLINYQVNALGLWLSESWPWILGLGAVVAGGIVLWNAVSVSPRGS